MGRIIRPPILDDEKFICCISLATLCKNDKRSDERHGSILVKGDEIIGSGRNRAIAHPTFRLERIIRQGQHNHAPIEALNDALDKGLSPEGGDLYEAGYFFASGRLFLQEIYTCPICPPYLKKYGIEKGKTMKCTLKAITSGTCTPVIFEFDEVNTADYFETKSMK